MDTINNQTVSSVPFKGFWIRLVAAIIDGFIIILFWSFTFLLLFSVVNTDFFSDSDMILSLILSIITLAIVGVIYKPIMETSNYQGTFGKYLLGMKIVNQNGQKISLTTSVIRTLVYFLQTLIAAPLTVWLLMMIGFTEYKQGLHDLAAKTFVVSHHWEGAIPLEDNFGV